MILKSEDKSKQSESEFLLNRKRIHKNSLILRSLKRTKKVYENQIIKEKQNQCHHAWLF